ncbi:peptidoglycan L-alanyl-D-glutamate endopeptidase [Flavobacterium cyanobacteriorum]|uniref:Peptidoglycan L-alanyl-D-glutamate endopeptidase n=1 Tax=Flavobacterium cyanobacteriorum TaxID=2022802 RepID=A0A255Z0W1_9FLAO|nr:M15 family metallopeptidase [Flavobacterium cyanobacteriorum]OYQ35049.1 peptidoglycan L-alanyl-D-glutamate endopeptidase [Flavobacterium cyanobacteriorum]
MDKPTQDRIAKLHPTVREEVAKIVTECNTALTGRAKIRITQGLRTLKEQEGLYSLGRTKVNPIGVTPKKPFGSIVTNARAGQSIHNYGFAVDICLIIDGKTVSWDTVKDWDNDQVADWYECVRIFAKYGWDWGGNWKKFKDLPHFEKKNFNSWQKLARLQKDSHGYVII